ncbi:FAD-dependent tricarballylate dehydrogenase TcuA [Salinigranum halophilum]|uniref:FAD-dependent tricarballylate dehydrogenase TcuA n=1 Tax=Salinigranum halophilum TaxID=2565931 RepID=UPI0010A930A5|nr:FAD-dependent tricarballylate dehydrogenase TcuA [Salinigranum halophilum]
MPVSNVHDEYDIIVVGHGISGLSTAIAAHEAGANPVVLEKSPKDERGGHSRFAGATMRFPMEDTKEVQELFDLEVEPQQYTKQNMRNDLMRITNKRANPELLDTYLDNAYEAIQWIHEHGVEFTVKHKVGDRKEDNPLKEEGRGERLQAIGEGEAVVETLGDRAEELGIDLHFETEMRELMTENKAVTGVGTRTPDGEVEYHADAVVICAGSYVSNTEKRTRYYGRNADNYVVRGSRHNRGDALDAAIEKGAMESGQWGGGHQVLLDANAPEVEGGRTRINGYQYGVIVNQNGERFVDEGEDLLSKTYAKFGRHAFEQPNQCAFVIYDSKVAEYVGSQMGSDPLKFDSLEALVEETELNGLEITQPEIALQTIDEYNAATTEEGEFDPKGLDGKATEGLNPPKSNWAVRIDEPPFYCYPVRSGITFGFGGLKINSESEVLDTQENPIPGLWAVGNSTSEIFYNNYAAGSAQTRGAVFGRIAGKNAAEAVLE